MSLHKKPNIGDILQCGRTPFTVTRVDDDGICWGSVPHGHGGERVDWHSLPQSCFIWRFADGHLNQHATLVTEAP